MAEVEIIPFSSELRAHFRELNYEWIKKYFELEETDVYVLTNPEKAILEKGGYIYFAKYQDQIVGTFSLKVIDQETIELGKMSVSETFRGNGIGKALLQKAIEKSKEEGFKRLVLYSSTLLVNAVNMYINFGFRLIPKTDFHTKRANIKMELSLTV